MSNMKVKIGDREYDATKRIHTNAWLEHCRATALITHALIAYKEDETFRNEFDKVYNSLPNNPMLREVLLGNSLREVVSMMLEGWIGENEWDEED